MCTLETTFALKELVQNGNLGILRKAQKQKNAYNYYFTPNLSINLYNANVIVSNEKYIVLQFNKSNSLNLLGMLRNVSVLLYEAIKDCYVLEATNTYNLVSEQDETFTLRVHLPRSTNKYNITYEDDKLMPFKVPKKGATLGCATIELRNLWEKDNVSGFNLELKSVKL